MTDREPPQPSEPPLVAMAVIPLSELLGMAEGGIPRNVARAQACYRQVLDLLRTLHDDAATLRDEHNASAGARDGALEEAAALVDTMAVEYLQREAKAEFGERYGHYRAMKAAREIATAIRALRSLSGRARHDES